MGHPLQFSDHVTHLGHILQCSLDDNEDIRKSTLEMCKKANMVLSTFSICDPHVKTTTTLSLLVTLWWCSLGALYTSMYLCVHTSDHGHCTCVHAEVGSRCATDT